MWIDLKGTTVEASAIRQYKALADRARVHTVTSRSNSMISPFAHYDSMLDQQAGTGTAAPEGALGP
jgi:hypothetical protein